MVNEQQPDVPFSRTNKDKRKHRSTVSLHEINKLGFALIEI